MASFKLFFCFALLSVVAAVAFAAEKDAPKAVENNERVKKAVIIPPPTVPAAYGYYGSGYYGHQHPYYYGNGVYPAHGLYDDGKYYPGKYNDGKYHLGKYDDGKYYPGKYDDGKYYPGKYEKTATALYKPYGGGSYYPYNGYYDYHYNNKYYPHYPSYPSYPTYPTYPYIY